MSRENSPYQPRRIKQKWLNKVHPNRSRCIYCWQDEQKHTQAVWREYGSYDLIACDEHEDRIPVDSDEYNEADYSTWLR